MTLNMYGHGEDRPHADNPSQGSEAASVYKKQALGPSHPLHSTMDTHIPVPGGSWPGGLTRALVDFNSHGCSQETSVPWIVFVQDSILQFSQDKNWDSKHPTFFGFAVIDFKENVRHVPLWPGENAAGWGWGMMGGPGWEGPPAPWICFCPFPVSMRQWWVPFPRRSVPVAGTGTAPFKERGAVLCFLHSGHWST